MSSAGSRDGLTRIWLLAEVFVGDGWKAAALPRMAALRVGCMRRFAECGWEVTGQGKKRTVSAR